MVTTHYNALQIFALLTVPQERAIELLLIGVSDAKVANQVSVHRVTVTRWRLYHPAFRASARSKITEQTMPPTREAGNTSGQHLAYRPRSLYAPAHA